MRDVDFFGSYRNNIFNLKLKKNNNDTIIE